MRVSFTPSLAKGTVCAPPSKSMAHRALICAAFSKESQVSNLAFSKDITATLSCLKNLGANCKVDGNSAVLGALTLDNIKAATIDCNESGSTLRFLIPLCMCAGVEITLCGSNRLFERGLSVYEEIAKEQNMLFKKGADRLTVCGKLKSGDYHIQGDISSQFISGMLFVLPLLDGDSTLTVEGKFESASYVRLTLAALVDFGIEIEQKNNSYYIKGNQTYKNCDIAVEGDCSNAAFLDALNFLGGNVTVMGLKPDTLQGDRVYKDIFDGLASGKTEFDLSDCPDLAPVCFALAAYQGNATFTGTARLKIKESDRAAVMAQELAKFGAKLDVLENSVIVKGGNLHTPTDTLYAHNDHRIAMALSLLCTKFGGRILGAESVAKSYPDFFDVLKTLAIGLVIDET